MKRYNDTTSYSIAHYILVFLVVCACIVGVVWILIAAGYRHQSPQQAEVIATETVTEGLGPCAQQVTNEVAQMWAYSPNDVPQQYWEMAASYVNDPVDVWTEGVCNDIRYICNPGQVRRECDPCAVSSGMGKAMEAHTKAMIAQNCPNE